MGSILPTIANHLCLILHVPVNHFTKKRVEHMLRRVLIGIAQAWSATGKFSKPSSSFLLPVD